MRYIQSIITVIDRRDPNAPCECYRNAEAEFNRLAGD